jgi:glycosyltransferase involved in cell wall biosynthesis
MKKLFFAHSWTDVSLNIQTKKAAIKLSEHNKVVFFTQSRIGVKKEQFNDNLLVLEWPHKRPSKIQDVLFFIWEIIKHRPDTIIVHFGATNMAMMICKWLGVKNRVCWMHTLAGQIYLDVKNDEKASQIIQKRITAYKRATHIVVQNKAGWKDAVDSYKIDQQKLKLIYNGIEDPLPNDYNKSELIEFGYIGRLDYSKGVDVLLRVIAKLKTSYPNIKLKIAGKGAEDKTLRQLAKDLGIVEQVNFIGWLTNYADVKEFIKDAYALVVPSRLDNFPTVVLEALACKTVVIASNVGGIPDMVVNEQGGYLFENENEEELQTVMSKLIENKDLWKQQSILARERFLQNFSMEKHVREVEHYITSLN